MKFLLLVCSLVALPLYSQTTGRVPTGSGTSLAPALTPGAVSGLSTIPPASTQNPVGGFTPNTVGGFAPNPVGGFARNPVGGFNQNPVGPLNQNPVGGFTPNPVTGFSQSPVTTTPTPSLVTTNQVFNLTPLAPATNAAPGTTPSPF